MKRYTDIYQVCHAKTNWNGHMFFLLTKKIVALESKIINIYYADYFAIILPSSSIQLTFLRPFLHH